MGDVNVLTLTFNVKFDEIVETDDKVAVPFRMHLPINCLTKEQLDEMKMTARLLILYKNIAIDNLSGTFRVDRIEYDKKKEKG